MPSIRILLLAASLGSPLWVAAAQPLVIDHARSTVEVAVKATVDSFTARLEAFDAGIAVVPGDGRVTSADFSFRFADLKTGKPKRDTAMLEWMGAAFPNGRFRLARLEPATGNSWHAHGTLTLHGLDQSVDFPVAITTDHGLYALDGEALIDTRRFGLPVIRLLALLKVDPLVRVRFHLQGALPATP